jgi:ABC-type nitrate/sulfonate/bicarbonate transport system substrate-binding protein
MQSTFYVLEDSPIKSVKDIAGESISVNTLGAHLDYAVREEAIYLADRVLILPKRRVARRG